MGQTLENAGSYTQLPSVDHILFPASSLVQGKCAVHHMGLAMKVEPMELEQQTQISYYL